MKFFADANRGGHFALVVNKAVLVAIACTALAMFLDGATKGPGTGMSTAGTLSDGRQRIAMMTGNKPVILREGIAPSPDGLDMTPTASIGRPIVLNPCLRPQK